MITKRDIVDRAFKLLSMSGYELDDSPEDSQDILQMLDDMMAELPQKFGYLYSLDTVESYLQDDSGIARDAISGISHKLALRIANMFGKPVTAQLANQADDAYNALLTRYQTIPDLAHQAENYTFGSGNVWRW